MLRKLKCQIPAEPLAARYNWCQGLVPGHGPAVEKHYSRTRLNHLILGHPLDHGPYNSVTMFLVAVFYTPLSQGQTTVTVNSSNPINRFGLQRFHFFICSVPFFPPHFKWHIIFITWTWLQIFFVTVQFWICNCVRSRWRCQRNIKSTVDCKLLTFYICIQFMITDKNVIH